MRVESGLGITIDPNSFFSDDGIGIDLNGFDGLTPNDPDDGDSGPNNLQNFPDLAALIDTNGDLVIDYFVDSDPGNSAYPLHIELFIADADDEEGKTFLASDTFADTDFAAGTEKSLNLGNAASLGVPPGTPIVATATDANGNTSEFSSSSAAGAIITTVAGFGPGFGGDNGDAVDAAGNVYIADLGNHRVRKVDTSGVITTVAGNGFFTGSIDGEGGDAADDLGDGSPALDASLGGSPRNSCRFLRQYLHCRQVQSPHSQD